MKKSIIIKILTIILAICSAVFAFSACKQETNLTLKFLVDGETYHTVTFSGGELTLPENPTKTNYSFDGWYLDENSWQNPFSFDKINQGLTGAEISVYAKFTAKHNHSYTKTDVNATCDRKGYSLYQCACGDFYVDNEVSALGHEYNASIVSPTCTDDGFTLHSCACGESYKTTFTAKLNHSFTTYVSNNDATCLADGTKTAICDRIGCNETDTIVDEGSKIDVTVTFNTLTVNANSVTAEFNNSVTEFNFANEVTVTNGASYFVATDKNGLNVVNNLVSLANGENYFYVFITLNGEVVGTYNVEIYRTPTYTVSFNTNGGSAVQSQSVVKNGLAIEPTEVPTKTGYQFIGWDFDFTTPITQSVEINAIWQETLTFISLTVLPDTVQTEYAYNDEIDFKNVVAKVTYNNSANDKFLTYSDLTFEYDEDFTKLGGVHAITVKYYDALLSAERSTIIYVTVDYAFLTKKETINMFVDDGNDILDFSNMFTVNGNVALTYTSSDASILSFNGATATAKKKGTVTITVANLDKGLSATATVVVYPKAINVDSEYYILVYNETQKDKVSINVVSKYENLNYTSSNNNVITYSAGECIAKGVGVATLKISDVNNTGYITLTFEVVSQKATSLTVNSLSSPMINLFGRNQLASGGVQFEYTVSGFEFKFYGTSAYAELSAVISSNYMPRFQVLVDGEKVDQTEVDANGGNTEKSKTSTNGQTILNVNNTSKTKYTLVEGLTEGWHTVKVLKRTPAKRGGTIMDKAILYSVSVNNGGYLGVAPTRSDIKIEVYGDSISCAYGNLYKGDTMHNNTTNGLLAYHYLAAEQLGAEVNVQAHSGWGIIYDTSGATSWLWPNYYNKFSNGSTTYDMSYDADIIVINLGTNDTSGASNSNFTENFATATVNWVKTLLTYNPDATVLLTYGMMGKNTQVISGYESAVTQLKAQGYNNVYYYTYQGTYDGGGHPSKEDHISNSTYLANKIKEILNLN